LYSKIVHVVGLKETFRKPPAAYSETIFSIWELLIIESSVQETAKKCNRCFPIAVAEQNVIIYCCVWSQKLSVWWVKETIRKPSNSEIFSLLDHILLFLDEWSVLADKKPLPTAVLSFKLSLWMLKETFSKPPYC
jgi:hypothetical protein